MEKKAPLPSPELDLDELRAIRVLGKGAMGTVFLVRDPRSSTRSPFALKVVERSSSVKPDDTDRRARWEISLLARLAHPFLPTLLGSLESPDFFAWAVPFCPGGDLNVLRHRQTDRVFSPSVIRFYVAEIVSVIQCLHDMGIAYRDLKPENVLIQRSGHVTLTDFDLSRTLSPRTVRTLIVESPDVPPIRRNRRRRNLSRLLLAPSESSNSNSTNDNNNNKGEKRRKGGLKKAKSARVSPVSRRKELDRFSNGERSNSFVGTEEYVAPEVVRGDGHEFSVDWWALGVLTYEMLYGTTPFRGKNRKETFWNILMKPPEFIGERTALTDLIGRLLAKDPSKRLGYNRGACEIREHEFFKGLRWDLLTEVVRPPFLPSTDEDGGSTESLTGDGGFDIRVYFQKLRAPLPSSIPPSPLPSPDHRLNVSLTEF